MKPIFKPGDVKSYKRIVQREDLAAFHGELVHPVYSTFSLARDIEWTTRQFVIDMRDEDEEGIGTFLTIDHKSPAFEKEEVTFTGRIDKLEGNELICSVEVRSGERLVAVGQTGQKILKRDKIMKLFGKL